MGESYGDIMNHPHGSFSQSSSVSASGGDNAPPFSKHHQQSSFRSQPHQHAHGFFSDHHTHHLPPLYSSSPSPAAFFTSPCRQRRPVDRIGSPTQVLPQLVHRHHLLNWTNTTSACNWVGVQSSSSSSSTFVDGGQTVVFVALPGRGLMGSIPSQSFDLLPSLQTSEPQVQSALF